ncbi:MAG: aminotransferase class III-fold pyridoxal phosphate-dependent enzyme, partial [Acidobacteria bacterium]|nr:aminotransferase class III-fold pyridoxal phosphate-dependent enzyme [Acidobacteriota bacterium]
MPGQTVTQEIPGSCLLRRSFRKTFPPAVRGEGAYLWDSQARQYLDFSGSAAVNFIGHGVAEIVAAMTHQGRSLEFVHGSQFTTPIAEQYAEELLAFAGESFSGGAVYFSSGGSEAVETALKLARQYQVEIGNGQRSQIISRNQSYHGATLGAMAVSRNRRRREIYRPMLREFAAVNAPYCYRCPHDSTGGCFNCGKEYAAEIEQAIALSADKVCAVILEPVSGATLGAVVPPPGYLEKVSEICKNHEILLIADEVMCGMGRTGKNFAVDHWGVTPDVIVAAKGLSSGYSPLGAVIMSGKVVQAISSGSGAFIHGFTYSSHPISLAAGRAVLRQIVEHRLVEAADSDRPATIASQLRERLAFIRELPSVGDVRGIGLLWAVEFVSDRATKAPYPAAMNFSGKVAQAAQQRRLLVYPVQGCADGISGDHVLIAPPAVISEEQIAWASEQLAAAIVEASFCA